MFMKDLKGTKTEANLMAAFAGESQAHTKYKYYASKAKKMAMYRLAHCLRKLQTMKRNMQKFGSNCFMTVCRKQQKI